MDNIYETTSTVEDPRTEEQSNKRNVGRTVAIVAGIVVLLALIAAAIYGMVNNPGFTAVLRDIFIIVLALVTIIIGLFLAILIFQLQSLIALLRDEIKPILESANQTVTTVRGTTTFVSGTVVKPIIGVAAAASGVGQAIKLMAMVKRPTRRARRSRE